MTLLILFLIIPYLIPGIFLARGIYSEQIKQIRSAPVAIAPPKPERPDIRLSEMLHTSSPVKCALLKNDRLTGTLYSACTCKYRDDWIKLKNQWIDYDEWQTKFGRYEVTAQSEPVPKMLPVYSAIPFWPFVMASKFIKGGAKTIPDYREIERLEKAAGLDRLELN